MGIDGKSYQISYQKTIFPQKYLNLVKDNIQLGKKLIQLRKALNEPIHAFSELLF